jgi:O-acetyl-ADP-ribose deacetylase
MPFSLVSCDIADAAVDCIVVAANEDLLITGGVGLAVAERAGFDEVQAACRKVAPIKCGDCALTDAFGLNARHILHAVGPIWQGGGHREDALLASTYANLLQKARHAGDLSIAMPLISTGAFGFPVRWAFDIAVREIERFLATHDEMDIKLVLWGEDARATGKERFPELASYIEDVFDNPGERGHTRRLPDEGGDCLAAPEPTFWSTSDDEGFRFPTSTGFAPERARRLHEASRAARQRFSRSDRLDTAAERISVVSRHRLDTPGSATSLEDMLKQKDRSFSEELICQIDERGMKDPEVYRAANITRQLFSKIRSNPTYRPTKKIALALAVALRLSIGETRDLLARAGLALSHASVFDIIVEYHIANGIYDVATINEALYSYDQELLGSCAE